MENLGSAFTLPFRDREWGMKFFLGSLFLLLSVFGLGIPVVCGYMVRTCQRVMRREGEELPQWSDVGVLFITGVKYIVVVLIYQMPIILAAVPLFSLVALGTLVDFSGVSALALAVYALGLMLLTIPYTILFILVLPVITYRFSLRESILEALDIGSVVREFRLQWEKAAAFAIVAVVAKVLSGLGILLFIVGVLPALFYSLLVFAVLSAFLYRGLPAGRVT